jgi:hypothetical protein
VIRGQQLALIPLRRSKKVLHMPTTTPLFNGKYRLVSWNEPACPVPPEEKGVRYLSTHLTTYKEAELELKLGALSESSWPLEGSLRVSPSQGFSVRASVAAGHPSEAEGILLGNKNRGAWFNARHEGGGVELSIGYHDATQKAVPVQTFLFKAEATTELVTPAKPVADPGAALAETWTARLRGTRISYMRNNDFQRDYSGGSFYWQSGWDIYLYDDATFKFRDGARTLAGRWGVVARNRNIYLELTSTEENLSYRVKHDGSYLTLNSLVCSWSRIA